MTVELYGLREEAEYGYGGWTGRREEIRELVATFDTEEMAEAYVRASRLKNSQNYGMRFRPGSFRYRASSLLRNYASYEIEEPEPKPPHNPTLGKPNSERLDDNQDPLSKVR